MSVVITSEAHLQAACHRWFNESYPAYRGLGFMIHNDGKKSKAAAATDKARGLVAGIPDWCLAVPVGSAHGLYIELKFEKGVPSKAQERIHELLAAQGYRVEVVRTVEEFQATLTQYLS